METQPKYMVGGGAGQVPCDPIAASLESAKEAVGKLNALMEMGEEPGSVWSIGDLMTEADARALDAACWDLLERIEQDKFGGSLPI